MAAVVHHNRWSSESRRSTNLLHLQLRPQRLRDGSVGGVSPARRVVLERGAAQIPPLQ